MATYSYGQLEQLWIQAGGPRAVAPLMAAIALAESGGNPQAANKTDNGGTQTSWGLWQISDGTHNEPVQGILNPLTNAQQAVDKYKSQGLGAWGTYTSGAFRKFYKGNVSPTSLPQGGGELVGSWGQFWHDVTSPFGAVGSATSGAEGAVGGLIGIENSIAGFLHGLEWFFIPGNWVRIICGLGGVALMIPGLKALMQSAQGTGDASLAIGILLITAAGALLFIAFHNLPDDVRNLQSLLGWITQSISQGKSADSATAKTQVV